MKARRVYARTTIITSGLVGFLLGLGFARLHYEFSAWFVVATLVVIAMQRGRRDAGFVIAVALLGFFGGWWRGAVYLQYLAPYSALHMQKVVIVGVADSDGVYSDKTQLAFDMTNLRLESPASGKLVGKIGVAGFGEKAVYKGDTVRVEGKLFQTRGSRQASIGFADLSVVRRGTSRVQMLRREFAAGLQSAMPDAQGSLGMGLLVGQRTTLPDQVNDQLSTVGLTHIVAVSGFNLTVLVGAARKLFGRRSKYQSAVFSVGLIFGFLLFTGMSASIVRAAIVSGLSLWAWYYGRTIKPLLLIVATAAMTAGWFPPYLWSDIGWYLSFLAFGGILIMAPQITKRLYGSDKKAHPVVAMLVETMSAQLITAPLIMYIFGSLSLVSLVANVMVVPLVPVAMGLAFVSGIAGMVVAPLAGWIAWPCTMVLTYMLSTIAMLAHVPGASAQVTINLSQMLGLYAVMVLVLGMWWHRARKFSIITDETEGIIGVGTQQMVNN